LKRREGKEKNRNQNQNLLTKRSAEGKKPLTTKYLRENKRRRKRRSGNSHIGKGKKSEKKGRLVSLLACLRNTRSTLISPSTKKNLGGFSLIQRQQRLQEFPEDVSVGKTIPKIRQEKEGCVHVRGGQKEKKEAYSGKFV